MIIGQLIRKTINLEAHHKVLLSLETHFGEQAWCQEEALRGSIERKAPKAAAEDGGWRLAGAILSTGLESNKAANLKALPIFVEIIMYTGGYKLLIGVKGSIWQVYVRIKLLMVDRRSKRYLQTEPRAFLALRYF